MPDKALITACHEKHACQETLTEGAQRNARDWILGAFDWHDPCSRAGLRRSVAGLWFLCRSSSLSVFVYTKRIQIEAEEGKMCGTVLQHHQHHLPPFPTCAS